MNPTTHRPLDSYETELLDELRREVARRAMTSPQAQPDPPRVDRPPLRVRGWVLAGGAVAAVATIAVGSVLVLTPTPAYALSGDGESVQVTIARAEDAAGLQQALAERGFSARVDYLRSGQVCAEDRFLPAAVPGRSQVSLEAAAGGRTFSITKAMGTGGRTAVITLSGPADSGDMTVDVAEGPVAACDPRPGQPPAVVGGPAPSSVPSSVPSSPGSSSGSSTGGR